MIRKESMKNCCKYNKTPFVFKLYKYVIIVLIIVLLFNFLIHNSSIYFRTGITMPFSLHLNKQDIYMVKGEETHLSVFGINKRVSFYSTNFRVAGVNFNGRVFAYQTGKAFIVAKVDGKELKCRVHVIDINKNTLELKKGKTYRLKISGTGANISWKSNHKTIATVNMFGKVKAKRKGTAVITAKVKGRTLKCIVVVR